MKAASVRPGQVWVLDVPDSFFGVYLVTELRTLPIDRGKMHAVGVVLLEWYGSSYEEPGRVHRISDVDSMISGPSWRLL